MADVGWHLILALADVLKQVEDVVAVKWVPARDEIEPADSVGVSLPVSAGIHLRAHFNPDTERLPGAAKTTPGD